MRKEKKIKITINKILLLLLYKLKRNYYLKEI